VALELMQHDRAFSSNPGLQWDEGDRHRELLTRRKFSQEELNEMDFAAYLESGSTDEENENQRDKYKALLMGGASDEDERVQQTAFEMDDEGVRQMTFVSGLESKTTKLINERGTEKDSRNPFEAYLEQRAQKKKERRDKKKTIWRHC